VDPVPNTILFFLVVPGIEPGPPDLYPRTLTAPKPVTGIALLFLLYFM
jgi:hypothetical protein